MKNPITKLLSMLFIGSLFVFTVACSDDDDDDSSGGGTPATTFSRVEVTNDDGDVVEVIVTVKDFGNGVGTRTLTSNTTWVLDGLVFVNSGQTLTIEAGTVIKGKSGQGENASALVVARGGRIAAQGTASNPIIMTAEADQIRRNSADNGFENGGNLPVTARGLWGGLIMLGNARLNSTPGETAIEGIPTTEARGLYGGSDDADNSGTVSYISIRHGGTDIGAGNEINGFTLGGVGSGTTIDHIEIIANNDDGIEFFGGTASVKYLMSIYCGDDAIDYDEGWRGNVQFALVYQDPDAGDRGGEHDGGTDPEDGNPYATPVFYNVTSIGRGDAAGKRALTFRDNAGGEYHNSIFMNYGKGVDIEDLASGEDSRNRLEQGDLRYMNNIHWNIAGNDPAEQVISSTSPAEDLLSHTNVSGNVIDDPMMTGVVPSSTAASSATSSTDTWFSTANYKGAFEPGQTPWYTGWSLTDEAGIIQ